jgi:outer membrane cobalamin receptor
VKVALSIVFIAGISNVAVAQQDNSQSTMLKADSIRLLEEVTIVGAMDSKTLQQRPINISSIDTKQFYNTNIGGLDLLRQVSGIKIKQDGGFGARSDFFINGSTGKQVKFFIDGIPQDNLGETQLVNIYPIEQTERIEVYKGILPVDLGADALGAAINIVTRKEQENYYDASYAVGSFNTHKLNLSGKRFLSKHLFLNVWANANYTQNNYEINGEIPNSVGTVEIKSVPRFHDGFKNYNLKLEVGLTNKPFADLLLISLVNTQLYDELQNNLVMTQPYGEAFYQEKMWSGNLKYSKNNLVKKLDVLAALSYSKIEGFYSDTSKNVYTWDGRIVGRKFSGGEISSSGNSLHIYTNVVNAKLTATYHLSEKFKVVLSNTLQHYYRTGKDTVAQNFYNGLDYFGAPSSLTKNIIGLGIEGHLLDKRIRFSSALKNYSTNLSGSQLEWTTQTNTSQSLSAIAYNAAIGFRINSSFLLKTSYEHAARLPEAEEAFGDFMLIKSNPRINIEQSENVNLSFLFDTEKWEAEVTGFYRDVSNIIYLRSSQFSSMYQNLLSASVLGVESNIKYQPFRSLYINANATFQDMRNQSTIDNSGINNDRYKNARLPNIPYLFVNGGLMYKRDNIFGKGNALQIWWNSSYTHEYFLYWEIDGAKELKNRIPTQLLHYAGVSYSISDRGVSFAVELSNVTNTITYDNFKVQLPGRAISFKIRVYQVNQNKNRK